MQAPERNPPHSQIKKPVKLGQGQVWKLDEGYLRIVKWERLTIDYKAMEDLDTTEGTLHHVTKKEFCRLIKGAVLHVPDAPGPE